MCRATRQDFDHKTLPLQLAQQPPYSEVFFKLYKSWNQKAPATNQWFWMHRRTKKQVWKEYPVQLKNSCSFVCLSGLVNKTGIQESNPPYSRSQNWLGPSSIIGASVLSFSTGPAGKTNRKQKKWLYGDSLNFQVKSWGNNNHNHNHNHNQPQPQPTTTNNVQRPTSTNSPSKSFHFSFSLHVLSLVCHVSKGDNNTERITRFRPAKLSTHSASSWSGRSGACGSKKQRHMEFTLYSRSREVYLEYIYIYICSPPPPQNLCFHMWWGR